MLPDNGNADIENGDWIVNMEIDAGGSKRVTVKALSEMGAIIEAEERFGGSAISAYPKASHTPRCPICAGLNCKNPHECRDCFDQMSRLRDWLQAHKGEITHFRPRRWCGAEMLLPYDRRQEIPLIAGAPMIYDTRENAELIREVLGPGFIEERFAGIEGSRNY